VPFGFAGIAQPALSPAAAARLPSKYEVKDFVGDQQGVDDMTTSTITMLHNNDTVTLINPFEGTTAHFTVKTVTARSELELTGWKAQPAKTDVSDFTLVTGETKAYTLAEGTDYSPVTGFLPEKINRDIYITLTHVDTPSGETQYTGAGQGIFGAGGYWNPQNIIKRVRARRMVVGPMSLARPPAGGSVRAGRGYGGAGGASERASVGIRGRNRAY